MDAKNTIYTFLDNCIAYFLFIFIVCEHHVKFTAIKNISLYLGLTFSFIMLFMNMDYLLKNLKINFRISKNIIIPIILFVVYAFIVSLFPYDSRFDSFSDAFSEFGRGLAFLFIVYVWSDGSEKK